MKVDLNQGFKDYPGLRCFLGYLTTTEDVERDGSVSNHFHLLLPSFGPPPPTQDPLRGLSLCSTGSGPADLLPGVSGSAGKEGSVVSFTRPGETWVRK